MIDVGSESAQQIEIRNRLYAAIHPNDDLDHIIGALLSLAAVLLGRFVLKGLPQETGRETAKQAAQSFLKVTGDVLRSG